MRPAFRVLALVAFVASSAAAAPSAADKQRAQQSFQIGKTAYGHGDYKAAAAAFEQAAMYAPHPNSLLVAAESWSLAGYPVRAAQLYDRVLEFPVLESEQRKVAEEELLRLDKKVGTIVVKAPSKARVVVDDRDETAMKVRVAPGPHKLQVTGPDGETRSESITVGAGEKKEIDFLTPKPEPEPVKPAVSDPRPRPAPASSGPPVGTWVSFGAAAAAGGAAVFFGVRTLDAQSSFDAQPTVQARDDFNSARLLTNVAIGVAAAAAVLGIILWVAAPSPEPRRTSRSGTLLSW